MTPRLVLVALLCTLSACSLLPTSQTPPDTADKVRLGDAVTPTEYRIDLTALPGQQRFSGHVAIGVNVAQATRTVDLNGMDLRVDMARFVTVTGATYAARYRQLNRVGLARLTFDEPIPAGTGVIEISYGAPLNDALESLYKVRESGRDYLFSQFETTSARLLFPGFDEPGFKTPFTISVTTAADQQVIGNMPIAETVDLGGGLKRVQFQTTPPLPTYLLALVLGPLDVVDWAPIPATAIRSRPVPLRGIAAAGKGERMQYALGQTAGLLEQLEAYFGIPYPYPKLDVIAAPDFAAGAMENVGAILYREYFLLLDEQSPLSQKRNSAVVQAHEMAHQWFGNLVTPEWWVDTWLNESFATWMSYKTVSAWDPDGGYERNTQRGALHAMDIDSLASARQIRQPIESHDDIANAFDGITYAKGGGVLAMFESYLGEDAFRAGVRTHLRRFAGGNADAADFMESLGKGSGNPDVVPAFTSFINQPGVPSIEVTPQCGAHPQVHIHQQRYRPLGSAIADGQSWQIPVCMTLLSGGQASRQCVLLSETDQTFDLPAGTCPEAVMPNANGAGYYRFDMPAASWQALLERRDRLNAAERLALARSIDAAFHAGSIEFDAVLRAARAFASDPEWDVASTLVAPLIKLHNHMLDDSAAAALRSWMIDTYAPRLEAIGLDGDSAADRRDPTGTTLLRKELVAALALTARESTLRAELSRRARRWIGNPDAPSFTAGIMPADIQSTALRVAVEEDPELGRRLVAALDGVDDSVHRYSILAAAAAAPELAEQMQALTLSPRLHDNEMRPVLGTQFEERELRAGAWNWLRKNLDGVAARTPAGARGGLITYADGFCSVDRANEITAFFTPRLHEMTGAPRRLALTLEQIELCTTLREQRGRSIAAALQ